MASAAAMGERFCEIIPRKCCHEDDRAAARKKLACGEDRIMVKYKLFILEIDPDIHVLITGVKNFPPLNGEYCMVESKLLETNTVTSDTRLLVRRICDGGKYHA